MNRMTESIEVALEIRQHNIGKNTVILMLLTFVSRLMGFARDVLFAHLFGASANFDVFLLIFRIPNFIRRLLGEGAFSQAWAPIITQRRYTLSTTEFKHWLDQITVTLLFTLLVMVILVEVFSAKIVFLLAPGLAKNPAQYQLAQHLLRIMFPYLLTAILIAWSAAVLNTFNRFVLSTATPIIFNLILILAVWLCHFYANPSAVLWLGGFVLLAGVVQYLIQLPLFYHLNLFPKFSEFTFSKDLVDIFLKTVPAMFAVSVVQISLLIDNLFASFLTTGSISWLYYADRLIYFPLGLIGVAFSISIMPLLSKCHHHNLSKPFSVALNWGLRNIFLMGVPAAIGIFCLAKPITLTLLHHGQFTEHDVEMTAQCLQSFAIGLPSFLVVKIFVSAYFSKKNMKIPVMIACFSILINLLLNFPLMHWFAHFGLALSTALTSWINAVLLWAFALRKQIYDYVSGWGQWMTAIVVGSLGLGGFLGFYTFVWGLPERILDLSYCIIMGFIIYLLGLGISGIRWRNIKPPVYLE